MGSRDKDKDKGDGEQKLKIGDDYSIVTSKGTYKTLNAELL